jgi:hypothetical protein
MAPTLLASDGLARHHCFCDLGIVVPGNLNRHRRVDDPRTHRVDANSPNDILKRGRPRQADDRVLTSGAGTAAFRTDHSANQRTIDDCTACLRRYLSKFRLHAIPDTAKIDVDNAIELIIYGKTAKTLDLQVNPNLLSAADEVIE